VFERLSDGSIKVTIMGNDTIFVRCDEQQGK
jgi:arginine repressor